MFTLDDIKAMDLGQIDASLGEIRSAISAPEADLDTMNGLTDALLERRAALIAAADAKKALMGRVSAGLGTAIPAASTPAVSEFEKRATDFVKTGRFEMRAVLESGKIAAPSRTQTDVNELAPDETGIVDDVHSIALTGAGAWVAPYKKAGAVAAAVTAGSKIGGTASTYDYVTISPNEWGVLDEVSNAVAKLTPVDYLSAVRRSAVQALRAYGQNVILTNVQKSALAEKKTGIKLDENFLRTLMLGYHSIAGKGSISLYITQADMATLGSVRGTDKKPVYEIVYDAGTTTAGMIREGGVAVRFRIIDDTALTDGTQLFGQPGTIDMPMWGPYEISTDNGGDHFDRNVMSVRGLQMANADLAAFHGMQVITQA